MIHGCNLAQNELETLELRAKNKECIMHVIRHKVSYHLIILFYRNFFLRTADALHPAFVSLIIYLYVLLAFLRHNRTNFFKIIIIIPQSTGMQQESLHHRDMAS